MTRARDVADTQDNVGGSVPPSVAGKNAVINGGFDIWQRGTSATFSGSAATYVGADRWWNYGGATCTVSRQTADTTGQTYGLRFGRNSGQTNTTTVYAGQVIESINSKTYAGQTVTISFYAKKGADAPSTLNLQLYTGTGTDQTAVQLFSGWTNGSVIFDNGFTITNTMTRYSYTGTIASTANQIAVSFKYTPTGTAGANEWFQIEGVQLELGNVATPFSRAGGNIQGELAACKRYYERRTATSTQGYSPYAAGYFNFSTSAVYGYKFETQKRVQPTITFGPSVGQFSSGYAGNGGAAATALTAANISQFGCLVTLTPSGTPFTSGQSTLLLDAGSATSYVEISAEL